MTWLTNPFRFGGLLSGPTAFWRLRFDEAWDDFAVQYRELGEYQLSLTPGGANLVTASTLTSTSFLPSGFPPANANDGNTGTWASLDKTALGGPFIVAELASAAVPLELRLVLNATSADNFIVGYRLEKSLDGVNYTLVSRHISRYDWTRNSTQSITLPTVAMAFWASGGATAPHHFWRVRCTKSVTNAFFAVRELRFRRSGVDLATTSNAGFAFTEPTTWFFPWATYGPHLAIENRSGFFSSVNMAAPRWLAIGYAEAQAVDEVTIMPDNTNWAPENFTIEYSDDGDNWTVAKTVTGANTGWTAGVARSFSIP
jgi:hypothetical protein